MISQEKQQKIEDRKQDRALINEVRGWRRKLRKELDGIPPEERVAFINTSAVNSLIEHGYTINYVDGGEGCFTISRCSHA
jgi:hypothetical protein